MPDHIHLVWMGLRLDSDQRNAMAFLRTYLKPAISPSRLQIQAHDKVLREEHRKQNAFATVCQYIAANPLRAQLVTDPADWPYTGCILPGYPKIHPLDETYWNKFWTIYTTLRSLNAGNIARPPLKTSNPS